MSYVFSAALQSAVYRQLSSDPAVAAGVGTAIYDAPLQGMTDGKTYFVTLGDEVVKPFGSKTSEGGIHEFDVTIHSTRDGFAGAKGIAEAICSALIDAHLDIGEDRIVSLRLLRAKTERGRSPVKRLITLRFRAVIDGV
ncbi:DUF3168 domain-containing protein [Rhodobacteraceae bacterium DSL-40]|uniref:DUF3168 domain-containing protein n=1 Tax=Amaricoccus sp. B4 TaxID=3368557 RepID=UPI000DAECD14